ncbi:hypothetical protein [Floridanema evergladense]|uniref:Uncharacterized protein n=1 Tax=Floridaenema evergladense BLCC-F167 TaxID=3153639 RepID=A0ABV4WLF4_9CYAN
MWKIFLHHPPRETSPINPSSISEIQEKLTDLKASHQYLAQLMNLETWAIVITMDDFFPGFWHRFMSNRQLALKKLLQQKGLDKNI